MQTNGKLFIDEENANSNLNLEEYPNEIIVHPKGNIKTIQAAVDMAGPRTRIKIKPAIYKETIRIYKRHDLEICSDNPLEPAVIVSDNSPCIKINGLAEDHVIKITNLRMIQRGIREKETSAWEEGNDLSLRISKTDITEPLTGIRNRHFIYQNANQIDQLETNYIMDINIIDGMLNDNRGNVSAITVLSGTVMISNVQISLAFLTNETYKILPGIYVENSVAFIDSVLVKGNKDFLTVGILCHEGNIKVINSKILNHRCGGILCDLSERNKITITKTQLYENTGCGILIVNKVKRSCITQYNGVTEVNLESNLFDSNQGVGVKIVNCFNLCVIGNKFYGNLLNGAELIDCNGLVMLNEFVKNKGTGLLLETAEETFDARIFKNIFTENYQNGIVVKGSNNFANISQNDKITNNFLSGIHVCENASPKIMGNTISTNLHQGILIVSDSHADITQNKIHGNIKANIAFGGKLAENTQIINNEIYSGRCEGIFCIEACGGLIARNKIYDNNDGIVIIKCTKVELSENDVFNNIRSGILVSNNSSPLLYTNQIYNNRFIGLFIRDESTGVYERNRMKSNITQVYLSNNCRGLLPMLKEDNNIEGRYDVASGCCIF